MGDMNKSGKKIFMVAALSFVLQSGMASGAEEYAYDSLACCGNDYLGRLAWKERALSR